jgi:hypothetical protein
MPRLVKILACLTLLALSAQLSWGFALLGPVNEPYQVVVIGYGPAVGDIGDPKNIGEEYRRNTPTIYYSYDANFVDFYGSNGVVAIDSAAAVFNAVTNMSHLSYDLSEFPLQATRENYQAEALNLLDLKSLTMGILCEQLGLDAPERFIWALHDRFQLPNTTCPVGTVYLVVRRNFDPVISGLGQTQNSSYVNGTLYSYFISEVCQNNPTLAVAVPFPVDPLDFSFTAIAGAVNGNFATTASGAGIAEGRFFTGLTRDDVGGLRYLYRTNLINFESTGPNSLAAVTNPVPQILFTSNLTEFAQLALTNDAPTLQTFFPNLNIIASSNYFVNVTVTNVVLGFTNYPWSPAGSTALVTFTNFVPTIQTRFVHTFGNLLVVGGTPAHPVLLPATQVPPGTNKAIITIETDKVGTSANPFGPAGSITITTNSTFNTFLTNTVVGDFVILATNLCSAEILATQLTWVTRSTNFLGAATNSLVITNAAGGTNAGTVLIVSQSQINYFTNHAYLTLPVSCLASNAALLQGMDIVRFVRRDFDSLLGRFFTPITNRYTLNSLTNGTLVPEPVIRTVTAPDILFTAADLSSNPGSAVHPLFPPYSRGINFNTNFEGVLLAGPGTIEPLPNTSASVVTWNKGPVFENATPNSLDPASAEASQFTELFIGSFDGTTNAPIVYPNGTSLVNLENQALISVSPGKLPQGQVGQTFGGGTVTFTATGGTPPYSWSLSPGSPGLPPGLFLLPNGTLGGIPTQDGTFDFIVRLTDGGGLTVDKEYSITIIP